MKCLRVVVSGAAGLIGYSLSGLLGDGTVFGTDRLVELVLHDIPRCEQKLVALKAELEDCAFPYVSSIEFFTDPLNAFRDADIVFFLASLPLTGPDRASLLEKNINIYIEFGKALEQVASRTCKSIVVANPANTLAYVLMQTAPSIPRSNFAALNRTDHNRTRSLTLDACRKAYDASLQLSDLSDTFVWGNHGNTMFADLTHAKIRGIPLMEAIPDRELWEKTLPEQVERRGWVLMELRGGVSSVLSVARASVDVARDWCLGTNGKRITMAVCSDGNCYGVEEGLIFGMPVVCENGEWKCVEGLKIAENVRKHIEITTQDLKKEVEIADAAIERAKNNN
ncbi:uncharacterized protein [Blastocystis hominis]|uniref:malate dehydrogenase n=1 Tax=Blastocystis hominis TaxID=12968 RepID=D8LY89_BLAHO|nr:uncharacterized protein [Blastocystis hominis]CBK20544.2 unnamed protein product [Blastocystis hominis]|eukprot:XP_012894592.1 uncharacterized protein [Blastocystis hominis]